MRDAFPELAGQGWYDMLDGVYSSGRRPWAWRPSHALNRAGGGTLEDIYFTFTYQPLHNAGGAVDGIVVIAVDVTTYVQARQRGELSARKLREERDRLQQVLDVIPEAIMIADASPTFTVVNQAARDILGPDVVGRPVPTKDAEAYAAFGARHLDGIPLIRTRPAAGMR